MKLNYKEISTLGALKKAGYQSKSIKDELRNNLRVKIKNGEETFTGVFGYDNSVIPELERAIPQISQKMLVQQLRELEAANIVTRKVYQQVPPRVEYGLSDYGRSLSVVLHELCVWGEDNIDRRRAAGEEIALLHRDDL